MLYVSQPEGVLLKLKLENRFQTSKTLETLQPLTMSKQSNKIEGEDADMAPEIMTMNGGVQAAASEVLVMCSNDGVAMTRNDKVVWFRQALGNHLFGLNSLDINLNGNDYVVCSTWEGETFILSQSGDVSVFHFDDEICGFSCGQFTVKGQTLPALVYATFSGMIHVYYNLWNYGDRQVRRLAHHQAAPPAATVTQILYGDHA